MLYSDPKHKIYIFEGILAEKFEKAAAIYKKKNNLKFDNLYDIGRIMLLEKVDEILQSEENND